MNSTESHAQISEQYHRPFADYVDVINCAASIQEIPAKTAYLVSKLHEHSEFMFHHTIHMAMLATRLYIRVLLCRDYTVDEINQEAHDYFIQLLLHDIGKLTWQKTLLITTSKLTDEAYDFIRTHPEAGFLIGIESNVPQNYLLMTSLHHARLCSRSYTAHQYSFPRSETLPQSDTHELCQTNGDYSSLYDVRVVLAAWADSFNSAISIRPFLQDYTEPLEKRFYQKAIGVSFPNLTIAGTPIYDLLMDQRTRDHFMFTFTNDEKYEFTPTYQDYTDLQKLLQELFNSLIAEVTTVQSALMA